MSEPQDDPQTGRASVLAGELRVLIGRLNRRLREQAHLGDLTGAQVSVLGYLDREGPATVTILARNESMRPQSMGANIAALEAAGLVSGTPDPADGRQTLWSVTPACRERVKAGRAAREDWLCRTIQSRLTAEEQEALAGALEHLKRLVEP